MELFELIVFLLVAVLISSVLDEVLPLFSLPLVQIALGVAVALVAPQLGDITLDPEFFLLLFIAPLLYNETQHVDKLALWRNKVPIVSLAIGLVLVATLAAGFALNLAQPSIALA
ncbi:MAG: cation:proton antiporter, partial [Coriobacteriales bacterium]